MITKKVYYERIMGIPKWLVTKYLLFGFIPIYITREEMV